MTWSSRTFLISAGLTNRKAGLAPSAVGAFTSRSMIVLQTLTHESQMYTPGPAMIFFTSACAFPQNEQRVMLADFAMAVSWRGVSRCRVGSGSERFLRWQSARSEEILSFRHA